MNPIRLKHLLSLIVENNDERAFSEFFDHYHTRLINLALLYLPRYDLAEDIVSEVLLKLLQKRESLLAIKNFDGYLFKMVKNKSLNLLKSKELLNNIPIDDINDYLIPESTDPEKTLINASLGEKLDSVIQKLPPKRRLVFKMIKDEHMSYREVADILGISERTVEVHLKLALENLRTALKQFYDEHQGHLSISKSRFLSIFL
ncbi:RNA polymerase sigma factor [Cyclobacterium qasimii]|uniref:RNA polymerase sigma-70 factor n=1 Tax=Cyclobacterium qasimii TaxID=1350429 RepID=A0A512C9K2_9BACT|nr:RNA polymerase sigma-70 factor [Cyclobacterium qasimii]GEO20891.1 RNA polymerase sigma-70 factor [Cyclobacterium qasimii]